MSYPKFCVIGAGAGGLSIAGYLAEKGCRVNVYNRSYERIMPFVDSKEIDIHGELECRVKVNLVTSDIAEAVNETEVIMVVVPAMAHKDIAEKLSGCLQDGQIVILNPGRTFGALEVRNILQKNGINKNVVVAEAQSLLFACRVIEPGSAKILKVKNVVPLSCIPSWQIPEIIKLLKPVIPFFIPGDNILQTGLSNIGGIFHPATTILNTAWIENTRGGFEFYHAGISQNVAKVLEKIDDERIAVSAALGIRVISAKEWIYITYGIHGGNLYEAIQNNPAYSGLVAPRNINHRYVTEDIPMSLVPISSLGDYLDVDTRTMKSIIQLASIIHDVDYFEKGRNVSNMGLDQLSVKEILKLALEG